MHVFLFLIIILTLLAGWQEGHLPHKSTCTTYFRMFYFQVEEENWWLEDQLTQVYQKMAIKKESSSS